MEITTILQRKWLFLKRRLWRITLLQMISPFLYFITLGMGPGRVTETDGRPYLYYLISDPLATTTIRNSYTSVSTRISVMRLHEESFGCYLYSPTRMHPLAMGHILAGAFHGICSGAFIVLLGIVSGARLAMNGWLLTTVILNPLIFSALGFLAATMIESHYDMNNFTNVVITPMSFLCGTSFSLNGIPEAFKWAMNMMPLTHTTRFIREISLGGSVSWPSVTSVVLLAAAFTGDCVWMCYREAEAQKQGLRKKL